MKASGPTAGSTSGPRVLYAVTSPLSLMLLRGQVRYVQAAGFVPMVLTAPGPQVDTFRIQESAAVFTVPLAREISPWQDLLSLGRIFKAVRDLRPLVCNAGTPKAGLLVGLAGWLNRVPCRVYTMRGLRLETAHGIKRIILTLSEKVACGCAHKVICVSPSLRARAIRLKLVPAHKAMVIGSGSSNGIDASLFERTPERMAKAKEIRRELGIGPDQRVIGYVGRLSRDKGVPELISAFRRVREQLGDAVLLLIGDYDQGDRISDETASEFQSNPAIKHILFQPDIAPYYLAMDVFVLPTHREGFPNTILEAQVAECPVVTTVATGAVDAVQNEVTGLTVAVNDPRALADAMLRLLRDRPLAERLARAGHERVMAEFQQESVWRGLVDVYKEMLKGQSADGAYLENQETI